MLEALEATGVCFLIMAGSGFALYIGYVVWSVVKEARK